MKIIKTNLKDLVVIQPQAFEDERGYFMESFAFHFLIITFLKLNLSKKMNLNQKNVL